MAVMGLWLGFGTLGPAVIALGWFFPGPLTAKLKALNLILVGVLGWEIWREKTFRATISPVELRPLEVLFIAIAVGGALVVGVACFSPITYYDSLVYHLALPSLYNQAGNVIAVPSNLYSYFPAVIEMIFLFIINQLPEPDFVINLWGWGGSLALSVAVAAWARELGGKRAATVAFFLWWTMPAVLFLSLGAYVDLPLGAFVFFAVRSFVTARENSWDARWLLLSGLFCGFASATKYTGAICPVLLFVILVLACVGKRPVSIAKLAIFSAGAVMPPLIWFVKNASTVGNPFFPFFYKAFGGASEWTSASAAGYFSQLTEYGHRSSVLNELLLVPWNLSAFAVKYGGGFDVLGDFGWPLLLFAAPMAFFLFPKQRDIKIISLYVLGHFLFWFTAKPVLRFLTGILPLAVMLSSIAIAGLLQSKGRARRWISVALVSPWIVSNFFLYFYIGHGLQPFSVALGIESRETYLSRRLVYYPAFAYSNAHLGPGSRILLIGEQRTYHLKVPYLAANLFASSPIATVANEADSLDDIALFLKENTLTHLLINEKEIERLGGMVRFGFSEKGAALLGRFVASKTNIEFENQHVKLIRIHT